MSLIYAPAVDCVTRWLGATAASCEATWRLFRIVISIRCTIRKRVCGYIVRSLASLRSTPMLSSDERGEILRGYVKFTLVETCKCSLITGRFC